MRPFDPEKHLERLLGLLEIEREAEKEENKRELDNWPVDLREALGKTVTRLSIEREDEGVGGMPLLILFRKPAGEALSPFHAMDQGDLVRVSFNGAQRPVDGTIYDVEEYRVSVALNAELSELPGGRCQLDLLGSDATYRRMKSALETVRAAGGRIGALRDILLGLKPASKGRASKPAFFDKGLNPGQRQSVVQALAAEDVALVHGPPGTGKTTVLIELIRQAAASGQKVLASAPSNIAVDNMVEKLLESGLRVVRLGHPARIMDSLRHATLTAQIAAHPDQKTIRELDQERERRMIQRGRARERGRGLTAADAKGRQSEIQGLWKEAREIERELGRKILQEAQVVLSTHGGLGRAFLKDGYDLAVLDEASQAVEPLSWIPIVQAKKAVLAGDPLQLPPTIYSKEAAEQGLGVTLMERLQKLLPDGLQTMLTVQYRMNRTIMDFSSSRFYGGRLEADGSVAEHLASELPGVAPDELTAAPLVFVDTAGTGYDETWNQLLDSRENQGEAALALTLWRRLEEAGVKTTHGAIITPYSAQAKLIKAAAPKGLEVGTVDGFQGREKEVVLVSLVRSNDRGEVGFLDDTRRMNVAMTRARRLLIVIGDSATIARHPFYAAFLDYVEKRGVHRSAWEWAQP